MVHNRSCDPHLRGIKRSLSAFEKDSVPVRTGRALVFPGEPPDRSGDRSEVDELITANFDPHRIYGIEQDESRADRLYNHFYDLCPIHLVEAGEFLRNCHGSFCYVHLDFSGQLKAAEFETMQSWLGKIDPIARVRVSVVQSRRKKEQCEYEESLRRTIIRPLLDSSQAYDTDNSERWVDYWQRFEHSEDVTQILAITFLLNFFFGLDARSYSDLYTEKGPFLPSPAGTHRIGNLTRFMYREIGGSYDMVTTWADLLPLVAPSSTFKKGWVLGEIDQVMSAIVDPPPKFVPQYFSQEV